MGMRKFPPPKRRICAKSSRSDPSTNPRIFTTQLPLDHWTEVIADPSSPMPSAIGCEHSALTINITGESYRGVKARKLASKKKDA